MDDLTQHIDEQIAELERKVEAERERFKEAIKATNAEIRKMRKARKLVGGE